MRPVRPKLLWNAFACSIEFAPSEPSTTSQEWCGARRVDLGDHPPDLRELHHQVALGVEAAGRVDDDPVPLPAPGRLHGVERDRGRVRARLVGHELQVEPRGPRPELVDRRRAEGVARGQEDGPALLLEPPGELRRRGRLARPVDADEDDHGRRRGGPREPRPRIPRGRACRTSAPIAAACRPSRPLSLRAASLISPRISRRGLDAKIRGEERLLKGLQRGGVDPAPPEEPVRLRRDRRHGLGEALPELLEERKHVAPGPPPP